MRRAVFLKAAPHHGPRLAKLHGQEWGHLYAEWNADTALREFETQKGDGTLPATILAVEEDELLGSVSLIYDDLPGREDLNPWLASLFVLPAHRGRSVGGFLLREAESLLRKNRVERIYLFTESATEFFRRNGWSPLGETQCHGHPVQILAKALGGSIDPE